MKTKKTVVSESRLIFRKSGPEFSGGHESSEKNEAPKKAIDFDSKEIAPRKGGKERMKRSLNESIDAFADFLDKNVDKIPGLGLVEKFAITRMSAKMADLSKELVNASTKEEIKEVSEEYVKAVKGFGKLVVEGLRRHELVKNNPFASPALDGLESMLDNLSADDVAEMVASLNMLLDFLPEPPRY